LSEGCLKYSGKPCLLAGTFANRILGTPHAMELAKCGTSSVACNILHHIGPQLCGYLRAAELAAVLNVSSADPELRRRLFVDCLWKDFMSGRADAVWTDFLSGRSLLGRANSLSGKDRCSAAMDLNALQGLWHQLLLGRPRLLRLRGHQAKFHDGQLYTLKELPDGSIECDGWVGTWHRSSMNPTIQWREDGCKKCIWSLKKTLSKSAAETFSKLCYPSSSNAWAVYVALVRPKVLSLAQEALTLDGDRARLLASDLEAVASLALPTLMNSLAGGCAQGRLMAAKTLSKLSSIRTPAVVATGLAAAVLHLPNWDTMPIVNLPTSGSSSLPNNNESSVSEWSDESDFDPEWSDESESDSSFDAPLSARSNNSAADPSLSVGRYVTHVLAQIGDAAVPAVPILMEALSHDIVGIRAAALYALRCLSPGITANAAPALARVALQDDVGGLRKAAVRALVRLGAASAPAVMHFAQTLADTSDAAVTQRAAVALYRLGPRSACAVPQLTDAVMQSPDAATSRIGLRSLALLGEAAIPAAVVFAKIAQDDPDEAARSKAHHALLAMKQRTQRVAAMFALVQSLS